LKDSAKTFMKIKSQVRIIVYDIITTRQQLFNTAKRFSL
jgi:hypothetical protein